MKQRKALFILMILLGSVISQSGCILRDDPSTHLEFHLIKDIDNKTTYTCTYPYPQLKGSPGFISVLEKKKNDEMVTLELNGEADSLAITPTGNIAALALDHRLHDYTFALVDTNSMKLMNSWELIFPDCEGLQHQITPWHFKNMDLSQDGNKLAAAYLLTRRCGEKKVIQKNSVSIWDTTEGKFIFELFPPEPPKDFPCFAYILGIYDVKFSPDDQYIALYGYYNNWRMYDELGLPSKLMSFVWPYYGLKYYASLLVWRLDSQDLVLLKYDLPYPKHSFWGRVYEGSRDFYIDKPNSISWIKSPTGLQILLPDGSIFDVNSKRSLGKE